MRFIERLPLNAALVLKVISATGSPPSIRAFP